MKKLLLSLFLVFTLGLTITSCRDKKDPESVEEAIDDAADDMEDAVEDAADDIEDAAEAAGEEDGVLEDVGEALDDAGEAVKNAGQEVKDAVDGDGN